MNKQINLSNGATAVTVAVIPALDSQGDSYVIMDDGCYVCVVPYQSDTNTLYRPTTHLSQAAVDVLKALPPLSST